MWNQSTETSEIRLIIRENLETNFFTTTNIIAIYECARKYYINRISVDRIRRSDLSDLTEPAILLTLILMTARTGTLTAKNAQ